MRSESTFSLFWARLRAGVVQDVPPSLEECETCREVECTQERWLACERRMVADTASLAGSTARTGDLPAILTEQDQETASDENGQDSDYGKRRKLSSH